MDYRKCAEEIYEKVGRRDNLVSAAHCATRLRLVTNDNAKVDIKALEEIDGVKGVFSSNGQLQLIIGTGTVNKVYDEFLSVSGMSAATKDDVKAAAAAKQSLPKRMVKALGDVFVPILPAIVASGLMMGLVEALGKAIPAFAGSDLYGWMDLVSNTAIVYLPVLVAISAARVFGGNIFLGGTLGLLLMHMNLLSAWTAASDPSQIQYWKILCFNIRQVNYQGHIIPIIIAIWLMCKIENFLHKKVPEMIDLFVTPLCTILITAFLTMSIIGPIFSTAESYVLEAVKFLITLPMGIGAFVCGAIYPLCVVCGVHHMFNVLEAGLIAENGKNIWLAVSSSANFAQCAACLAVAIKSKKAKTKAIGIPSALSASLGITEPAIFGVNLRFMKPLICGMVGGAFGAAVGAIMGVYGSSYGVTGIPGFLITTNCTLQYTIMLVVAFVISFILCMVIWKEDAEDVTAKEGAKEIGQKAAGIADNKESEKKPAIVCEKNTIYEPIEGKVIPVEEIPDPTFASGMLGKGCGIVPSVGEVVAPFDGTISALFPTKHAIGITSKDGMELLIHVGINTVELEGKHYEAFIQGGDEVKAGDLMLKFDIDAIKKAGYDTTTAVLLSNTDDYKEVKLLKQGMGKSLEKIIEVVK